MRGRRDASDDHEDVTVVSITPRTSQELEAVVDEVVRELDEPFPHIIVDGKFKDWPTRWETHYELPNGKIVTTLSRKPTRGSRLVSVHPDAVATLDDSVRERAVTEAERVALAKWAPTTPNGQSYIARRRRGRLVGWAHPKTGALIWRIV